MNQSLKDVRKHGIMQKFSKITCVDSRGLHSSLFQLTGIAKMKALKSTIDCYILIIFIL